MIEPEAAVRLLVVLLLVALITILVTRRIGVPYTVGLVVVGLVIGALQLLPAVQLTPTIVLVIFLPGLLFEGGWSLTLKQLRQVWLPVVLLVGPGLLLTVAVCAVVLRLAVGLDWGASLLLSAILAPTDPVAVLGLFRELGVGQRLRTTIEGESLFNDGVASVLYTVVLSLSLTAYSGQAITGGTVGLALVSGIFRLAVGGVVLGGVAGAAIGFALRWVDEPLIETTITLVAAYGVYLLADSLDLSGILAVVVLALLLGYFGARWAMSERTRAAVEGFWSQVAFIANAILFLLIGAQIDVRAFVPVSGNFTLLAAAGWAIVAVLGGRAVAVYALSPLARKLRLPGGRVWPPVLLWAGLRGALSLALVLALPLSLPHRELLVSATYGVVLFTLLVQGLTLRAVLKQAGFSASRPADARAAGS